jgi:hypothetical protein
MPGSAAGQLLALKEHNILNARLGQMVGHRYPDDAATHHNDFTPVW